jgi:hypothetical protein
MNTATQRAKIGGPDLLPTVHPFRVMQGETIIGQFSNVKLAADTAREYRGDAIVVDVSAKPAKSRLPRRTIGGFVTTPP